MSTSTYRYKGRGMVQMTGKQSMGPTPISSISISSATPSAWSNVANVTISGAGSGGYSTLGLKSAYEDIFNPHYKKYEIYEFEDDVLAVSCTWKRQRDNHPGEFLHNKITDRKLFDSISSDDREQARLIRDYYSKKIMMLTLKGQALTPFRKDLNTFIHGESNRATDELFPLIYRLPEFYEYDMEIEKIKMSLQDRLAGAKLEKKYNGKQHSFELTPITSLKKHNKRLKVIEYWFSINDSNPVLIQLEPKNPLLHIWDNLFSTKKALQISGLPFIKNMDDFEYLSIKNWKLNEF